MYKRILTIILAVVLIGCFFLPYYSSGGFNMSGYDSIFNGFGGDWQKYIPLLIPLSGVSLLIGALNNGNYIIVRAIWAWLPLLTILYLIIWRVSVLIEIPRGATIGDILGDIFKAIGKYGFKGYGIGLWITIGASLVLAVYNPRTKAS